MVSEWKNKESLYFESDSSLLKRMGRESISNQIIAIVELIKNSYDADAKNVSVIFENLKHGKGTVRIIDNGDGMTPEEISRKWMVLAVPDKENNPLTRKGRVKIGEKGIGRLGLEGLSEKLKIISKPRKSHLAHKVEINWNDYISGVLLNKVPNKFFETEKKKNENGFEIILENIEKIWDEEKIRELREQVSMITPLGIDLSFKVSVECKDYPDLSGEIKPNILKKHIFHFTADLDSKGKAKYQMKQRKGRRFSIPGENLNYSCGPVHFEFYFFYRQEQKYPDNKIDIEQIKNILNSYGGIKLYRDNFLVRLQRSDWLKLDEARVQDPSYCPGINQVFGFVKVSKANNPKIKDTTNREGLVENEAYNDLISFLKNALSAFKIFRREAEKDPKTGAKKTIEKQIKDVEKKQKRDIKQISKTLPDEIFIDFGKSYPHIFYRELEDEINNCKKFNLSNATMLLCRKMIENLLYNVLFMKFPRQIDLRFNTSGEWRKGPLDFSKLLDNLDLMSKSKKFSEEQTIMISKAVPLIKPFRKAVNGHAHNIMEYLSDISELNKFKIPEIIQILLNLIENIKKVDK